MVRSIETGAWPRQSQFKRRAAAAAIASAGAVAVRRRQAFKSGRDLRINLRFKIVRDRLCGPVRFNAYGQASFKARAYADSNAQ